MYTVAKLISRGVYTVSGPFHPFGGAVDIIVVEQPDGSFKSSPWYVRFGKFQGMLKTREKVVNINVNGVESNFHMYLDHKGEAYFLSDSNGVEQEEDLSVSVFSPPSSGEETDEQSQSQNESLVDLGSQNFDPNQTNSSDQNGREDGKIVSRTNSKRSRILGLVFGRKSMTKEIEVKEGKIERVGSLERAEIAAELMEMKWSTNLPTNEVTNRNLSRFKVKEHDIEESNFSEIERTISAKSVGLGNAGNEEEMISLSGSLGFDLENPNLGEIEVNPGSVYEDEMRIQASDSSLGGVEITHGGSKELPVQIGVMTERFSEVNSRSLSSDMMINGSGLGLFSDDSSCTITETEGMDFMAVCNKFESVEVFEKQSLRSNNESPNCYMPYIVGNSIHQDQEKEEFSVENKMDNLPTEIRNLRGQTSDSSDEDQFIFGTIDDSVVNDIECKEPMSADFVGSEDLPLVYLDDIQNEHDSNELNHDPPSFSDELDQEFRSTTLPMSHDELVSKSNPLNIPSRRKGSIEEVEWRMGSLPNFQPHIDYTDTCDVLHPLSCSLDSSSKNLGLEMLKKDGSIPFKSNPNSESVFVEEEGRDTCTAEELKRLSIIPGIELSLCKHLLYEGMGVDAASRAFEAQKVDLEKFISLASAPLKNDSLVIRIGGRYFPWDAAFPIMSGMPSFSYAQNFQPEDMIEVDQVGKILEGQSPRSIIASGGSWRWPFSFRRSRTMGSVDSGYPDSMGPDTENTESSSFMLGDETEEKVKVPGKKVRSVVPTSKQVASLNLKEGQNIIKFSFSTAMLGKQQVDARIYLWKWNSRIVISDVDGTITRSDVLGQFMPLVGKDWSQTGVAHLFSAIEENGYQFLFLSARSVSQAYLTRQFIINLKQDGKALPDGPVVISPDGLFPSLFREVIRRAPHEFKIACLEEIKALFPSDCNPFYAGFGNRNTDEISYLKVGIPKGKIFTINPKGEVVVHRQVDTKSYTSLHALVNGMFPAMSSAGKEEFNSWNYWKLPLHLDI